MYWPLDTYVANENTSYSKQSVVQSEGAVEDFMDRSETQCLPRAVGRLICLKITNSPMYTDYEGKYGLDMVVIVTPNLVRDPYYTGSSQPCARRLVHRLQIGSN